VSKSAKWNVEVVAVEQVFDRVAAGMKSIHRLIWIHRQHQLQKNFETLQNVLCSIGKAID
jgi:hypothetical protein